MVWCIHTEEMQQEACRLAEMAEAIFKSVPLPADELCDLSLVLPQGSSYTWSAPVPNKNETNNALTYYLSIAKAGDRRRQVQTALVSHILSEPAFAILRTREQLGYIVSASQWHMTGGGQTGLGIIVQSERDPKFLEQRVESFLHEMHEKIVAMGDEEFAEHKTALQKQWREAPKNLTEEMNRYWAQIEWGYLDFHRREFLIASRSRSGHLTTGFIRGHRLRVNRERHERRSARAFPLRHRPLLHGEGKDLSPPQVAEAPASKDQCSSDGGIRAEGRGKGVFCR